MLKYLVMSLAFAESNPVGASVILAALVVIVAAIRSEYEVRKHPERFLPAESLESSVILSSTPPPETHLPLPTFNPMPIRDGGLFARSDSPSLENAGKWLRKIEQQWKECVLALKTFAEQWNRYASNYPAIQFRIGMVRDAERDIERARDAVAKELESLLKLFGGPQEDRGPKELWAPLRDHERKALSRGIQLLGKHSINIACSGNVDCMKRAQAFFELFTQAGWVTTFLGPQAYGAVGAVAVLVKGKENSSLAHDLSNLLGAILGGTITSKLDMGSNSDIDVLLVIGPKPPADWR